MAGWCKNGWVTNHSENSHSQLMMSNLYLLMLIYLCLIKLFSASFNRCELYCVRKVRHVSVTCLRFSLNWLLSWTLLFLLQMNHRSYESHSLKYKSCWTELFISFHWRNVYYPYVLYYLVIWLHSTFLCACLTLSWAKVVWSTHTPTLPV